MNRVYLCIDLKTFYASVECVERGLDPYKTDLIVADPSRCNGAICLAISPHMKERGIKNRCRVWEIPKNIHPIVAKPRMKLYIKYSAKIYSIYLKYISKDDIHPYSIDEMFLDVTDYLKLYNKTPIEMAKMLMNEIYINTGISSAAGIGTNLYLTKVALDILAKHEPNHIAYLDEELYKEKLWHHLPITDFWRISYGTESRLHKLHLKDMYDIAHADRNKLYKEFGITAEYLIDHAWGIEPTTIEEIKKYRPKSNSLSNSQILFEDYNYKKARIVLIEMIDNLLLQLIKLNYYTHGVSFYIGYSKDKIPPLKVSFKLEQPTCNFNIITKKILTEYDYRINEEVPIRKLGISFFNIGPRKFEQIDLFTSYESLELDNKLDGVINNIKDKYGKNSILRATSYLEGATARDRNKLIGGHNAE